MHWDAYMHPIIQALVDVEATPDICSDVVDPYVRAMYNHLDAGMVVGWSGTVHRLPFISLAQCSDILAMAGEYQVNPDEDEDYQIPEFPLPADFDMSFIDDWTVLAYQGLFRGHAQLARYEGGETQFHHDMDSELTVVINLTASASGGTGIRTAVHRVTNIDPLPIGHGIMFPGRLVHHRGLRCYGQRNLLVLWLKKVDFETLEPIPIS